MKLLYTLDQCEDLMAKAIELPDIAYEGQVTFHCFWHGELNDKHLLSIRSCFYFNVGSTEVSNRKIILWVENCPQNFYYSEIQKYAQIIDFDFDTEKSKIHALNIDFYYRKDLSFYSDVVRYILLFNYGGVWFDLDVLFLRRFDPLLTSYGDSICVYTWERMSYPNGAIFISLMPQDSRLLNAINYIVQKGQGWGFQEASLTFDTELDFLVLPCAWFDAGWLASPLDFDIFISSGKEHSFKNFYPGSFAFHWHNQWHTPIAADSIAAQLSQQFS